MSPLSIGTATPWGEIRAIYYRGGERYYFCTNAKNASALMPAEVVEHAIGHDAHLPSCPAYRQPRSISPCGSHENTPEARRSCTDPRCYDESVSYATGPGGWRVD